MGATDTGKRIALRRPDRCASCQRELAVGAEAIWHRESRRVTCLACAQTSAAPPSLRPAPSPGVAGASARREYERRARRRENHARAKLGGLGVFLARVVDEPTTTRVWAQGASGELRTAERLTKHLDGKAVRLLHDRRVRAHGRANIDHLAVGPGGVTVVDSKTHRGKVRVDRVSGLFAPRRTVLLIGGRDQTSLIDAVKRQMDHVMAALARAGYADLDVRGALCFPQPDGLPLLGQLSVSEVVVDGPKGVARLAARPGDAPLERVDTVWRVLDEAFPVA